MNKINFKIIVALIFSFVFSMMTGESSFAKDACPDVEVIYIRGTGGERHNTDEWRSLTLALEQKMTKIGLDYLAHDLDYPASGAGSAVELADIAFSGGRAGEFGRSVDLGVERLKEHQAEKLKLCPDLKFLIVGYSQGAKVIAQALTALEKSSVVYLAFLGDPNLHLPEGIGAQRSVACLGGVQSIYRVYAPDCKTSAGLLGARNPYEPGGWEGKIGLWCNTEDLICGSSKNLLINDGHILYDDFGHFDKVVDIFIEKLRSLGIVVEVDSEQAWKSVNMDTVFLLDTTGSMSSMIDAYKEEALRLAKQTFEKGGRVALYEYRDLDDPFEPKKLCGFSCSLPEFQDKLDKVEVSGGGDVPESLLSAAVYVMRSLNWMSGANKSLVILTDAPYLSPDRDGTQLKDVVELSLSIDPVNFYIITDASLRAEYEELALMTGGRVFTLEEMSFLTEYVLSRPIAILPYEVYIGRIGDLFRFDASASYSVGSEIIYFEWDLNGDGVFENLGGSIISRSYDEPGEAFIVVKATDGNGMSSTMSAKVIITDSDTELYLGDSLGLISGAKLALTQEKNLKLSWELRTVSAKYVLISINEVLEAYVLYDQGELYITDLDFEEEYKIGLALMDENFDFAEFMYLNWGRNKDTQLSGGGIVDKGDSEVSRLKQYVIDNSGLDDVPAHSTGGKGGPDWSKLDWDSGGQLDTGSFKAEAAPENNSEEKYEIWSTLLVAFCSCLLTLWMLLGKSRKQKRLLFR